LNEPSVKRFIVNTVTSPQTPLRGLCLTYPAPGIVERIGRDWDWIWLDGQHGQIAGYDTMLGMVRACHGIGRPAYVRVPGHDPGWIGLALDMAPAGVIVPQIDTPAQAAAIVQAAKFPPLGNRSFGGRRPIDLQGRAYVESANEAVQLICQIESPEALENAGRIAAIPGIDSLFIGPDDLQLRLGGFTPESAEYLKSAITKIASACAANGKHCICVGISPEIIQLCLSLGISHLVCGSDVGFLAEGSASCRSKAEQSFSTAAERKLEGSSLY